MAAIKKEIEEQKVYRGLEGVVAAETNISFVDGENGELYYKGYNIHELANNTTHYAEIVYLLLYGEFPTQNQLKSFRKENGFHYLHLISTQ